jgi:hypothetical protein
MQRGEEPQRPERDKNVQDDQRVIRTDRMTDCDQNRQNDHRELGEQTEGSESKKNRWND